MGATFRECCKHVYRHGHPGTCYYDEQREKMNDGISKRIFKCAHMHLLLPLCVCVFLLLASAIAELSPEVWLTVDCMVALIGTVRRDPNQNPKTVVLSTAQAKITHFWDAFSSGFTTPGLVLPGEGRVCEHFWEPLCRLRLSRLALGDSLSLGSRSN